MGNKAKFLRDVVIKIGRQAADQGKLLETGWLAYRHICIPADCPPETVKQFKLAYMAGCGHTFSMVVDIPEETGDDEPTPNDLLRMDKISAEVDFWHSVLSATFQPTKGSA